MSSQRQPTPTFGEREQQAWGMVLDAIEDAMEVEGLSLWDRGRLAELHEKAAWHVGQPTLRVPTEWEAPPATRQGEAGDDDVQVLANFGLDQVLCANLVYRHKLGDRIIDIERRTDDELLDVGGIGPKRLNAIRLAIARWRAATTTAEVA